MDRPRDYTTELFRLASPLFLFLVSFRRKVQKAKDLTRAEANAFIADYIAGLAGYTYLEGEAS